MVWPYSARWAPKRLRNSSQAVPSADPVRRWQICPADSGRSTSSKAGCSFIHIARQYSDFSARIAWFSDPNRKVAAAGSPFRFTNIL